MQKMNKNIVLDASAILALLQREKGSEILCPLLTTAIASTVNITEVLSILTRNKINSDEAISLLSEMIPKILTFDMQHAKIASDLYLTTQNKGLSLGDRACIALGIYLSIPIYTADKIWAELNLPNVEIILIR